MLNLIKKKPKSKVNDYILISKYKSIFWKGYITNLKQVSPIEKVKDAGLWTFLIGYLNGENIISTFYKQELKKT